jgi:16S rRNA (guanine966-N2)-methyltransferase
VTRIVAGAAGGRTLEVPPKGTRPTSDRVREALFSRLEHLDALDDARVLDLYAGSGALGLEAASRGAREVVLVEAARGAAEVCRRNAVALGLEGVRVVVERVVPFLERVHVGQVDLALLDPPYEFDEPELTAALTALLAHLSDDAVVVVERSSRSPEPSWPAPADPSSGSGAVGLVRTDLRRYGETVLWFAGPSAHPRALG